MQRGHLLEGAVVSLWGEVGVIKPRSSEAHYRAGRRLRSRRAFVWGSAPRFLTGTALAVCTVLGIVASPAPASIPGWSGTVEAHVEYTQTVNGGFYEQQAHTKETFSGTAEEGPGFLGSDT